MSEQHEPGLSRVVLFLSLSLPPRRTWVFSPTLVFASGCSTPRLLANEIICVDFWAVWKILNAASFFITAEDSDGHAPIKIFEWRLHRGTADFCVSWIYYSAEFIAWLFGGNYVTSRFSKPAAHTFEGEPWMDAANLNGKWLYGAIGSLELIRKLINIVWAFYSALVQMARRDGYVRTEMGRTHVGCTRTSAHHRYSDAGRTLQGCCYKTL